MPNPEPCPPRPRDLGYEPVISFEDGWRQTIDWFKANPQFCAARGGGGREPYNKERPGFEMVDC